MATDRLSTPTSLLDAQIAEAARRAGEAIAAAPRYEAPREPRRPFASVRGMAFTWTLCLGLTLLNLRQGDLFAPHAEDPKPLELVAGLQISAALDGRLIEAYAAKHGTLPLDLAEVGLAETDPQLSYERLEPRGFRVVVRHGDYEGIFDSRLEAERRAARAATRAQLAQELAARTEAWVAEADLWLQEAEGRLKRSGTGGAEHREFDDYGEPISDTYASYPEESLQ